jgi:hypothetical protein
MNRYANTARPGTGSSTISINKSEHLHFPELTAAGMAGSRLRPFHATIGGCLGRSSRCRSKSADRAAIRDDDGVPTSTWSKYSLKRAFSCDPYISLIDTQL